jgi:LacI family transcriptional regulator
MSPDPSSSAPDHRPARRVTLADVARRAGVAPSTASNVLSGRGASARIPEPTAERIRAAAHDLGYVPDPAARSLRTGRTGTIGFVSDGVTVTRFASAMIQGLLDVTENREHALLIAECDGERARADRAIDDFTRRRVDGLLLGLMGARQIDPPRAVTVPTVLVNAVADGLPHVLPDEYRAGREATEYLLAAGHRRIALVGRADEHQDPRVSATIGRRLDGIDTAMREAGVAFVHEVGGARWEPELGAEAAAQILEQAPEVTAVLALNDRIAFGLHQELLARGRHVGTDLSIMSFDDEQLAEYVRPGLTTMRLPYREMGARATDLLLGAVTDGRTLPDEVLVPMPLVERGSVARV